MTDGLHSTGRGGAGNIGKDDTIYTDGGIIREGFVGESNKPEYSSGRGGAGNIVDSPRFKPTNASEDVVPEPSMRTGAYENFHTGRGGEGNIHKEKYGGHSRQQSREGTPSLGDKVKNILGLDKDKGHKKTDSRPTTPKET